MLRTIPRTIRMGLLPGRQIAVLVMGAALLLGAVTAQAQMPPDAEFLRNIRGGEHGEALTYLVNGGNPNAREFNGTPAILAAAEVNDAGMVRSLLEYGANPDLADRKTGETALMRAATTNNEAILALLIYVKADVDELDGNGETALIKAVRAGSREATEMLLAAGSDIELADYTGQTSYDHAMRGRDRRIRSLLESAAAGQ